MRTINVIEKDRFDINFFARTLGIERSGMIFKYFEIINSSDSCHNGTEGLSFIFTNCHSAKIVRLEWSKRLVEQFLISDDCRIQDLDSEHCKFPLPEFMSTVSPLKLRIAKFRGTGEAKFVPNFFDLTQLKSLNVNGSAGYYEMCQIWETRPSKLKHLKLCFADSGKFNSHVRSSFQTETLLDLLEIRIHFNPKNSTKSFFDDYNLDSVISISRLLDRNYTNFANKVTIEVDYLVFDTYIEGFTAMPLDLCFGSRLPTLEHNGMDHSVKDLQRYFKFTKIELPEDLTMVNDMECNKLVFRKKVNEAKRPYLFEILDSRTQHDIVIRAASLIILNQ